MKDQLDLLSSTSGASVSDRADPPKRGARGTVLRSASKSSAHGSPSAQVPAHHMARGVLFRELFEQDCTAKLLADPNKRTWENDRSDLYWRLHWSNVFYGKKKLKGPIADLCRRVGRNRHAEFDQWLKGLGIKGSNSVVRYSRLLAFIEKEAESVAVSFWHLSNAADMNVDTTAYARRQLEKARCDVGELRMLFSEMAVLLRLHRQARLQSAQAAAEVPGSHSG